MTEKIGDTCIDGGTCHHKCVERCYRRECCSPFIDYQGPWAYGEDGLYWLDFLVPAFMVQM